MNLTAADRADLERIRANHAEHRQRARAPGLRPAMFYAEWCGRFEVNVEELLDIITRLTAPDADHSSDGSFRYPVNHEAGRRPKRPVPSGTGWPVP